MTLTIELCLEYYLDNFRYLKLNIKKTQALTLTLDFVLLILTKEDYTLGQV